MKNYVINSAKRTPNSASSSSFEIQLTKPILTPKSVKLKWLIIPNSIYNVRDGINNKLDFTDTGGAHTITIPAGAYTITTLISQIQSQMTSVGAQTYTLTFNETQLNIKITASSAFSLQFASAGSCAYILGFEPNNLSASASYTGTKTVSLDINCIYMKVDEFGINMYSNDGISFTFCVPLTEDTGQVVVLTAKTIKQEVQLWGT